MKKIKESTVASRWAINTVAVLLVYFTLSFITNQGIINPYYAELLIPVGFYIILAVSLNLTCGFLGQLPLGHAGFMAVGAYASAIFTKNVEMANPQMEFFIALILGGVVASVFGIIVGVPALRLKGDYLAIITLGFGEIIRVIILNMNITGGALGLKGIDTYTDFNWIFVFVVFTIFITQTLIKSKQGRAIIAIRENEIAAEACGINTTYYKVLAFTIAAFFAGIAGGLYAHYIGILSPNNFGFTKSIEILVMVVLGGMGSIVGSVISATGLTVLPQLLQSFAQYRMVAYSLLLVIVMIFRPSGLMGNYDFSLTGEMKKLSKKFKKKGKNNV